MKIYNLMTGENFVGGLSKAWIMAWLGLLILAVILMLCKRWLGEEESAGIPYNWLGGGFGFIIYVLVVSFSGSPKWSLVTGLIGVIGGGFLVGKFAE